MLTTEMPSLYQDLEKMTVRKILEAINSEDDKIPAMVHAVIPQLERLVKNIVARMKKGGRLLYIGAGTSGRLGVLDASECPPTFGVPADWVIGIMAGGDGAIRKAVEFAEDNERQSAIDLEAHGLTALDTVIGIAASGTTPYVISGLHHAKQTGAFTGCITCNKNTPLASVADIPIEVVVGPEFVTGSTRMKAGTAQKLVLNMISTSVMIRMGRIKGNKMIDMQLSNKKLIERGVEMVASELHVDAKTAKKLLREKGSVRKAIEARK